MLLADWMLTPLRILEMQPSCPITLGLGDSEGVGGSEEIREVGVVGALVGCVR